MDKLDAGVTESLHETLAIWNQKLLSRNHQRSTFKNNAGWRQTYFVFQAIPVKEARLERRASDNSILAFYHFEQEHFITEAFASEEEALASESFTLRNSNIHHHCAIYRNGQWMVQNRETVSSSFENKTFECDRFVFENGEKICTNDYNCRETEEISLALKGKDFVAPLQREAQVTLTEQPGSLIEGSMAFRIYDFPDDPAKSVEIIFQLHIRLRANFKGYDVNSSIVFSEIENVDSYRQPKKSKLKKILTILLKSAVLSSKELAEQELGRSINDPAAFPTKKKDLNLLLDQMWDSYSLDYI